MSDAETEVRREEKDGHGRYIIALAPGVEAEMSFRRGANGTVIVDHTGVPKAFEGRGIAGRLMAALIADARHEPFTIVPLCSYVAAQFRRHPEWQDLLAAPAA